MNAAPTPLARALADRIARDGPIGVDEWMAACLADPAHGYYRAGSPIGAAGDFVTAPEISQIFGELLGAWAAAMWVALGRPAPLRLVELGPGRGTLMADALRATARPAPDFHRALDLHFVEIHPALRAAQRAAVGRPATWHTDLAGVPPGPAVVLANEFLDALPVRQLVRCAEGWRERRVGLAGGRFVFLPGPLLAAPPLEAAHAAAGPGDIVELPAAAHGLVRGLAARLVRDGGVALFVDYGSQASGLGDTLQAASRHGPADPLDRPGAVDLTAHVDFAALGAGAAGGVPHPARLACPGGDAHEVGIHRAAHCHRARMCQTCRRRRDGAIVQGARLRLARDRCTAARLRAGRRMRMDGRCRA
jgi:SAM-dependent MidA family methyltransferase